MMMMMMIIIHLYMSIYIFICMKVRERLRERERVMFQCYLQIVQSDISPVTASTNIVMSNFKHNYHVFGQQEAIFHSIDLQPDIILVIRFYLRKRLHSDETDDLEFGPGEDFGIDDDEDLVAWASMPLMTASHKGIME